MAWGTGAIAAPPPEISALVEHLPDGVRVTLRPHGPGRCLSVAFLLFWLGLWAAGEAFALWLLLALAGVPLGPPFPLTLPVGAAAMGGGAFLVLWLLAWTVGGLGGVYALLRLIWGSDVFTVESGGWVQESRIGAWGWDRRYATGQVERISLRRGDEAITADQGGKSVLLTHMGTPADRRWLIGLLRAATVSSAAELAPLALDPTDPTDPTDPSDALPQAPPGYILDELPDGTTCIRRAAGRASSGSGCLFAIVTFWSAIVGGLVAARLGWLAPAIRISGGLAEVAFWVVLIPLALFDLLFVAALLWMAFGREEWILQPDILEVKRAMPGRRWSRYFTGARLALCRQEESGKEEWRLAVQIPGEERALDRGDHAALRALGIVIATGTGWTLEEVTE